MEITRWERDTVDTGGKDSREDDAERTETYGLVRTRGGGIDGGRKGKRERRDERKKERREERGKERKGEASCRGCRALAPFLRITCTSTSGALYYTITVTKKPAIQRHPSDGDENKECRAVAIFTCTFVRVHTTRPDRRTSTARRRNEKEKMKNREREKESRNGRERGRRSTREKDGGKKDRQSLYSYRSTVRACASENTNAGSTRESRRATHYAAKYKRTRKEQHLTNERPRQESYL
ncbi:hypothetical protein WN48_03563 [Eufriesea mexicana]|nr:hypothetical protein WN48_03563 [Eufriesea mexicana]